MDLTFLMSDISEVKRAAPLLLSRHAFPKQCESLLKEWSSAFALNTGKYDDMGKRAGLSRTTKRVSQDSPVEVLLATNRNLQDRRRRLYLQDDFSMPFLY